jgi:hypothetical protein
VHIVGFVTKKWAREFFVLQKHPDWLCVLPHHLFHGCWRLFPGWYEVAGAWSWPLTPSIGKVKNERSYTSVPHYALMACMGATFVPTATKYLTSIYNFCVSTCCNYSPDTLYQTWSLLDHRDSGFSLFSTMFSFLWLHVKSMVASVAQVHISLPSVALVHIFLPAFSVFSSYSIFHHCSMLIYHHFVRHAVSLTLSTLSDH